MNSVTLNGINIVNRGEITAKNTIFANGTGYTADTYGNNFGGSIYSPYESDYYGYGSSYSVDLINCTFINNTAKKGEAMYGGSAVNCTFINNTYEDVDVTKFDTFISADDVSIAYKDPTGELVATIRNADGNALGVNLNVNFNGENYTIKADSNGKISLPIGVLQGQHLDGRHPSEQGEGAG